MRQITKSGMTRKLDKICSERTRELGHCQRCFKRDNLQCCHIFSRKNRSTRWYYGNLLCLCAGCHFWAHHNPTLFTEFVMKTLGQEKYDQFRANSIVKYTVGDLQILYQLLGGK